MACEAPRRPVVAVHAGQPVESRPADVGVDRSQYSATPACQPGLFHGPVVVPGGAGEDFHRQIGWAIDGVAISPLRSYP